MTTPDTDILDTGTGLQQLMGDRVLYQQILRRFRQRYQDAPAEARAAHAAGDTVVATRIAHTLKGAAGMIGARQVARLAHALESAGNDSLLGALEAALQALLVQIEAVLQQDVQPAPPAPYAASHMPTSMALVQHLASLLDIGDGAAVDVVEQSADALSHTLGAACYQALREQVLQFEYEAALALLPADALLP
ncbi:phosphotransfer domain-containing protein [Pseudoduganella sp. FT93W]|uniref:Phosphotransfer domain-containing protein n=1 Tax=Duganella fentianensis TaxID=2692177 RepID=A0A845HXV6_9BURK|nr:Hpt domain-containing protein [Duganella fentianensis]MYN46020.1 phosphotransfer domain-containing protein [Duganella fentianensis]